MPSGGGGGAEWEGGELMIRGAFERDGIQIKTQKISQFQLPKNALGVKELHRR